MGQLEDMAVFVRIVESGGIGKASEQLNIAKSAVSRRLVELETKFKIQLINRTTRQWSLTEAGENYYRRAKSILEEVSDLNEEIISDRDALTGTLKLTVPLAFGMKFLDRVVEAFCALHPELKVHIDLSDKQLDIVEEGFELAIRIAELEDSTLRARRIAPIRHALVASPDYLSRQGFPKSVAELAEHDFLKYSLSIKESINIQASNGADPVAFRPNTKFSSNNGDFLKEMAIKGHGITYLPTFSTYEDILEGRLTLVLADYRLPILNLYAVYPNNRFLSTRARAFIDYFANHCGESPYWDEQLGIQYQ